MFKNNRLLLAIIFCVGGVVLSAQQKITLDEAINIALSESNTIKIADMTIEKTGYAKKGAYSALYPNISATGNYQRTLKKQVMVMDMGMGDPLEIEVGTSNNVSAGVTAAMPLVNAQLWQSLKLSALDVELAVEQARSSKISLVSQVKQSFYAVLLAKEAYEVYKEVYDNAQKNFEDIEKKYNVGKASEFEYLRAKVNVNNAEPEVYSAENAIVLAIWQLKAIMGIDLATELDVEGKLSDYTDELIASTLNANDTVSFENNTNLLQLRLQDEMLSRTIKMTKFQYIPTLSASFAYNYNAMGNTFDMSWNPYSVVALSLNIPIFDGFSKRNNIRQYKKTQDILRLNIEDTERNLNIALENYRDKMNTSVKRYTAAEATLEMAQKSYNISEKMYELGKATLVELNDAQLALTQAQLTMSQAIYQYMTNKAAIDELMGVEYITEENNSDNQ
ncbi:MAG: TolC family protein [Bacteroidales bacterium]|nr:TolC family protein [Lentimicrobiaceae bacterium]MBQ2907455.1 TolC family protein [Bacteroidales bacterium]MBQ3594388.1 TolC family protein [Bacteroidales bacterium]MBR3914182.1 TolC family protein [Bacteroidales bacterium]